MPSISTLPCVFISYAREDRGVAERLANDLKRARIEVWIDLTELEFGTSDWETEIRDALEQSRAVLLVATPASRRSPHVRSELMLAEARHLPIYVVWMAGDNWIDSIPLKLAHTQYIDLRDPANLAGFSQLTTTFFAHGYGLPSHFIYESFYARRPTSESSYQIVGKRKLASFAEIRMSDLFRLMADRDCADTLFVDPSAYSSLAHLLDDIFVEYLSDRFPPFSYGKLWHLQRERWGGAAPLALDWWYTDGSRYQHDAVHLLESPGKYGVSSNSAWQVVDGTPAYTVTVAAYDDWLVDTIIRRPKSASQLMMNVMAVVDIDDFVLNNYAVVAVLTDFFFVPPEQFINRLLVQTRDCTSEIKARWG
jgi:hypothetical protein